MRGRLRQHRTGLWRMARAREGTSVLLRHRMRMLRMAPCWPPQTAIDGEGLDRVAVLVTR